MFIPFDELKSTSRIWIFQANRKLKADEKSAISSVMKDFTSTWAAHGKPLNSSFEMYNDLHLIVGVDLTVNEASGCSIDALTQVIQALGRKFDIDFFDRTSVAYEKEGKVLIASFKEIKDAIAQGEISFDTPVYNNLVDTKEKLSKCWKVAASESWLKRFLEKRTLTT